MGITPQQFLAMQSRLERNKTPQKGVEERKNGVVEDSAVQLNDYENNSKSQSSFVKSTFRNESMAEKAREGNDSKRLHLRIVSYRRRLCDVDNLCPKYFIDCLRYAEIIQDDSPEYITLEVSQIKVHFKWDERTEIEINPTKGAGE